MEITNTTSLEERATRVLEEVEAKRRSEPDNNAWSVAFPPDVKSVEDPLVKKVLESFAGDDLIATVSDPGTSALHFGLVGGLQGIKSKLSDPSYNVLFSALRNGFRDLGQNIDDPRIWLTVKKSEPVLSRTRLHWSNPLD